MQERGAEPALEGPAGGGGPCGWGEPAPPRAPAHPHDETRQQPRVTDKEAGVQGRRAGSQTHASPGTVPSTEQAFPQGQVHALPPAHHHMARLSCTCTAGLGSRWSQNGKERETGSSVGARPAARPGNRRPLLWARAQAGHRWGQCPCQAPRPQGRGGFSKLLCAERGEAVKPTLPHGEASSGGHSLPSPSAWPPAPARTDVETRFSFCFLLTLRRLPDRKWPPPPAPIRQGLACTSSHLSCPSKDMSPEPRPRTGRTQQRTMPDEALGPPSLTAMAERDPGPVRTGPHTTPHATVKSQPQKRFSRSWPGERRIEGSGIGMAPSGSAPADL